MKITKFKIRGISHISADNNLHIPICYFAIGHGGFLLELPFLTVEGLLNTKSQIK